MTIENKEQDQTEQSKPSVSIFGYELIREILLTDILGNDAADILYWGGKSLARRFPCTDSSDLSSFFEEAGWGKISVVKEGKREQVYHLSGEMIERRIAVQTNPVFTLECGFIAEQAAIRFEAEAEAVCHLHKRSKYVEITVKWE